MKLPAAAPPTKARLTVIAVLAAFVLPIFLAWLLSSGVLPWLPRGRLNYGTLIEPPLDLKSFDFFDAANARADFEGRYGEWTLAAILPLDCNDACRANLDHMHRIHLALREEMDRVRLAAIVERGSPEIDVKTLGADARTRVYHTSVRDLVDALVAARVVTDEQSGYNRMFLIEYASHAIIVYPPGAEMAGVTRDIKRLLRASKTN